MNRLPVIATVSLALLVAACSLVQRGSVDESLAGNNWATPGGDAGKSHFSTLTDIDAGNVDKIGLAWEADLGTGRGMEATPVVVDGVMYTSGVAGRAYAFDAATGKSLWKFEPEIDSAAYRSACCDSVNRGVAVHNGQVFVAALDAKLYALDAKSGAVTWQADTVEDRNRGITSTGAPEVADDVVIIGNGGAEYDVRGYVSAYDIQSGKLKWRFHTIPRDPKLGPQDHPDLEQAAQTWDPDSRWDIGGGGTAWDAINYDSVTGLVLVGVGNGGPYHHARRSPSGGDNLYLSSIVALDPKTGRVKWHYQETQGDSWDYTATQPMVLTDMEIGGEKRPVILHAPKNGFFYILDRRDGKLLSAEPIAYMNWANGIDMKTGRPNLTPEHSDYSQGPKIVFPASVGARNWQPGAFDPTTGLYYASVVEMGNLLMMTPGAKPRRSRALNNDAVLIFTQDLIDALPTLPPPARETIEKLPEMKRVREKPWISELRAIDPKNGKTVWAQKADGWQDRSGALATASGLVFQGNLAGQLRVFDARTGKLLKSIGTGGSIMAAPMTYRVHGVQYVAVAIGWGGGGWPYVPRYSAAYKYGNANRIVVFRLGGGAVKLPTPLAALEVAPEPPAPLPGMTPDKISYGRGLFYANCAICHSNQHRSISPDLRRMSEPTHEAFRQIVLKGVFLTYGMPRWDDLLSEADVDAIHGFLIEEQKRARTRELGLQHQGKPIDTPVPTIMSVY